jgi:precorrin-6Y C5,15-methyltransferase (decarboxylating)
MGELNSTDKVYIIGIGQKPLDGQCIQILREADAILASPRLMEVFPSYSEYEGVKDKVIVITMVDDTLAYLKEHLGRQSTVLLASGDPLFYGIGRIVTAALGPEHVVIFPDLSSIQVAFARIKERWDDAFLFSLHGGVQATHHYTIDDVPFLLEKYRKIAVLTDKTNNPSEIAKQILASPLADSATIHVCERLGYPAGETVTTGRPSEIAEQSFSDLNVVIVIYPGEAPRLVLPSFGLREDEFSHSRGLITKDEVRAVSLHTLCLPVQGVLWDVGAGCGSVSIEAARLCPGLRVYAVEKEEEQTYHITSNIHRFGTQNVLIIKGEAPAALAALPSPNRVFIGGGGDEIARIVETASRRMAAGIMVINSVTLETLSEAVNSLEQEGFATEVRQIGISRSKPLAGRKYLLPLTQIFVIKGERR